MQTVILDDISFGDPAIDALFARWRAAIEKANNWSVTGNAQFNAGPGGYAMHVGGGRISPRAAVVATGGISAAPNANTLGSGNVMLRWADGAALTDDHAEVCYSNFSTAVAAGKRCMVEWDGSKFMLISADCP
jgi:hypothetical protein